MGNIFVGTHVVINMRLFFHDICVFIRKEPFDDNIKFFLIRREQAFRGRRSLYPENIVQMFQLAVKEQIIRFVAAVSGNDIFIGNFRVEMVQHGMQCFPFIRILSGLDDNIQKGFADNINEAVKVHMVIQRMSSSPEHAEWNDNEPNRIHS